MWSARPELGSTRLDFGSEAGIWASWQGFELLVWNFGFEVSIWASRLVFWALGL